MKVLDFGLAKCMPVPGDQATRHGVGIPPAARRAGALVGTVAYMSPGAGAGPGDRRAAPTSSRSASCSTSCSRAGRRSRAGTRWRSIDAHPDAGTAAPDARLGDPRVLEHARRMRAADARQGPASSATPACAEVCRGPRGGAPRRRPAPGGSRSAARARAVAVLSFANITGNRRGRLAGHRDRRDGDRRPQGVEGLTVVLARERVYEALRRWRSAAGETDDGAAARVGREVGARWVLSGGYQRLGDGVRRHGAPHGGRRPGTVASTVKIDGRMDEIFELQDRIVPRAVGGPAARRRLPTSRADGRDPRACEAYEAFSKGVLNLRAESHEALDRAILFFERAVQLDPGYARAHLQLGSAYETEGGLPGHAGAARAGAREPAPGPRAAARPRPRPGASWAAPSWPWAATTRRIEADPAGPRPGPRRRGGPLARWAAPSSSGRAHFARGGRLATSGPWR